MRFFRISSFFSLLRSAEVSKFLKCTDRAVWGSKVLPVCSPTFLRRPVFEKRPFGAKRGRGGKKKRF